MVKKRVQFFQSEEGPYARIYENHTVRTIRDKEHLEQLATICDEKEASMDDNGIVHGKVYSIIDEYDKYIRKTKAKFILYNLPKVPMALVRAYPKTTAVVLAAAISITGITTILKNKSDNNLPNEPKTKVETTTEDPSYPDEITYDASAIAFEPTEEEMTEAINNDNVFTYYSNKVGDMACVENARRYQEYFEKYGNMYGVDPELLIAIAAQEGSGNHYENVGKGAAEGIMQIQKSVHIGETLSVYNYQTNQTETITITAEDLQDLEKNIRDGAAIWADYLRMYNGNIPLTIQAYNFGPGNMRKVLNACSEAEGISKEDIINDPTYNGWMDYRNVVSVGDPTYVENVFKFLDNDKEISVQTREGAKTITIHKEPQKSNTM